METQISNLFANYQLGKGFSPKTVQRRSTALRRFEAHIHPTPLIEASADHIESFIAVQAAQWTKRSYRSDLVMFYRWATKRRVCPVNPAVDLESVRIPSRLPRPVPSSQVPRILNETIDPTTKLMIALAAYAGLRCHEIAALTGADLELDARKPVLNVRAGKGPCGGKDRTVPLHPTLAAMLAGVGPGRLFNVADRTVGIRIAHQLRASGINMTAHKLRHTFGTELARASNGNIILVARLMGHSDTKTTMGYIALAGIGGAAEVEGMYPDAA